MNTAKINRSAMMGLLATVLLAGCNTGGGGGGGGTSTPDPLADYQLGEDTQLDADVAAITVADNEGVTCLGQAIVYEDEDVLNALKAGYPPDEPAEGFPAFVAETAGLERIKVDEICDTTLENASADLTALIERLTVAANQNNECIGEDPDITDEDSLLVIKKGYFGSSPHQYTSMTEFAEVLVEETEGVVAEGCEG